MVLRSLVHKVFKTQGEEQTQEEETMIKQDTVTENQPPDESTADTGNTLLTEDINDDVFQVTEVPEIHPQPLDLDLAEEDPDEEGTIKVVKLEKVEKKPIEKALEKEDTQKQGDGDLFENVFSKIEEEADTYLGPLIASLPDITIQELLNEAAELKKLIQEWDQTS